MSRFDHDKFGSENFEDFDLEDEHAEVSNPHQKEKNRKEYDRKEYDRKEYDQEEYDQEEYDQEEYDHEDRKRGNKGFFRENKVGKIIVLIQIVLSVVFLVMLYRSSLFQTQIFLVALLTVFVFAGVFAFMQFFERRFINVIGIVLSIVTSFVLIVGSYYLYRIDQTVTVISGADTTTVQMVVIVLADDPAEELEDAADYVFGFQNTTDTDNMKSMRKEIKSQIGDYEKEKYDSVVDVAQALLDEEVGAAIINSAFIDLVDETIDGFSDEVKVIYTQTYEYAQVDGEDEETDVNTAVERTFNILVSGIDTEGDISNTSRSDVNIIMTVNMDTKKILMTTTPRDYYVEIPGVSNGQLDKLTHAGLYGVETSMATLENLYGIDIEYYIRVNFTSLVNVVDALGGITVHSDYAFTSTHGGYSFVEGDNYMTGDEALGFSRERYAFSDGDNQRGKNQQYVLTGILEEMTSVSVLKNADAVLDTMLDFVQTNMDKEQLMELVGEQLVDQSEWTFELQAATGTGDKQATYSGGSVKRYVMWPDEDVVAALANRMQLVIDGK